MNALEKNILNIIQEINTESKANTASTKQIADRTNLSLSQVDTILSVLKDKGFITAKHRTLKKKDHYGERVDFVDIKVLRL